MPVTAASALSPSAGKAKVAWALPTYSGGATITQYIVTLTGNGKTFTKTLKSKTELRNRTWTFSGLRSATTYTARIVAVTKYGKSDSVSVSLGVA